MDTHSQPCRHCGAPLVRSFANLGSAPVSNDYLSQSEVDGPEPYYPLHALVCDRCKLVQLKGFFRGDDLFRADYAYFSSISSSWLAHCEHFANAAIARFGLSPRHQVVEIASNDGYLLQYFQQRDIPVLGVEPSASVAEVAMKTRGVPTMIEFFGTETARSLVARGYTADLVVANNVLAHVPDINDFAAGFKILLKPEGVATFEFPHLLRLIEHGQFDTIYHEHFSYLSLLSVSAILECVGLRVFDVEPLQTHGGSLRLYVCHPDATHELTDRVAGTLRLEREGGLEGTEIYETFNSSILRTKAKLISLLFDLKSQGGSIVGYGAAAKGNTLLNYCGLGADVLDYVVDKSPHKQGLFLPGSRLPILNPDRIIMDRPDYVLILPWNIKDEVMSQLEYIREWGGRFIVAIPQPQILA